MAGGRGKGRRPAVPPRPHFTPRLRAALPHEGRPALPPRQSTGVRSAGAALIAPIGCGRRFLRPPPALECYADGNCNGICRGPEVVWSGVGRDTCPWTRKSATYPPAYLELSRNTPYGVPAHTLWTTGPTLVNKNQCHSRPGVGLVLYLLTLFAVVRTISYGSRMATRQVLRSSAWRDVFIEYCFTSIYQDSNPSRF